LTVTAASPNALVRAATSGLARRVRRARGVSVVAVVEPRRPALVAVVVGYLLGTAVALLHPATGARAVGIVARVVVRIARDLVGQVLYGRDGPDPPGPEDALLSGPAPTR
jgi:hypothetical protein